MAQNSKMISELRKYFRRKLKHIKKPTGRKRVMVDSRAFAVAVYMLNRGKKTPTK